MVQVIVLRRRDVRVSSVVRKCTRMKQRFARGTTVLESKSFGPSVFQGACVVVLTIGLDNSGATGADEQEAVHVVRSKPAILFGREESVHEVEERSLNGERIGGASV